MTKQDSTKTKPHSKPSTKPATPVDVIIVGQNILSGALVARYLEAGHSVALADVRDDLGSLQRTKSFHISPLVWRLVPDSDVEDVKSFLSELQIEPQIEAREDGFKVYEEQQWKSFLGFGETKYESIDALKPWLSGGLFLNSTSIEQLNDKLRARSAGAHLSQHKISKIDWTGKPTVTLSSGEQLTSTKIIWTASPRHLLEFVPHDLFSQRDRKALARSALWSLAEVFLQSKTARLETPSPVMMLGQQDAHEPVMGLSLNPSQQEWFWCSPYPAEQDDDDEVSGDTLRFVKRMARKAYGGENEVPLSERVSIHSDELGSIDLKLESDNTISGFPSLVLASPSVFGGRGLGSMALAYKRATANLQKPRSNDGPGAEISAEL